MPLATVATPQCTGFVMKLGAADGALSWFKSVGNQTASC
jgi:hypothetical protein